MVTVFGPVIFVSVARASLVASLPVPDQPDVDGERGGAKGVTLAEADE